MKICIIFILQRNGKVHPNIILNTSVENTAHYFIKRRFKYSAFNSKIKMLHYILKQLMESPEHCDVIFSSSSACQWRCNQL